MFVEKGKAAIIEEPQPTCEADTMLAKTLYSGVSVGTEKMFLLGAITGTTLRGPSASLTSTYLR